MLNDYDENVYNYDNKNNENIERVYVDWPDMDNEEFRFISSRMEEIDRGVTPMYLQQDWMKSQNTNFDKNQSKLIDKSKAENISNERYEDLSKKKIHKKFKNSSVPPLDLISQNSSIEIPGAKGIIDIDLRSSSESLSDNSQDYQNQSLQNFERDSLDVEQTKLLNRNDLHNTFNPLLNTTLPDVKHSDLMINPGEYDSSRHNQYDQVVARKFSEISVPSQYRTGQQANERNNNQRTESEKAIFEAVKQKYKQPIRNTSHKSTGSQQSDAIMGSSQLKNAKSKPTMLVAPQIKQSLHGNNNTNNNNQNLTDKTPNYIELNKITSNVNKQQNQSSYASKFIDRHRKESPKAVLKKSQSFKDSIYNQNSLEDQSNNDQQHEFFNEEYLHKRHQSEDRSVKPYELPFLNSGIPISNNHVTDSTKSMNPHILYAYNQFGEPIVINTDNIIIPYNNNKSVYPQMTSPKLPVQQDFYSNSHIVKDIHSQPGSPSMNHKMFQNNQETNKSNDYEFLLKDANFKRQPTLYDENLLIKKLKEIKSERTGSRFPPIPNSSDSSQNQTSGYAANHKRKEINYEQYTLRDFRNLKQVERGGGLGPNIGTDSYKQLKEKLVRQKNYSKAVQEKNRNELIKPNDKSFREKSVPFDNRVEIDLVKSEYTHIDNSANGKSENKLGKNIEQPIEQLRNDNVQEESKLNNNEKAALSSTKDQINKRETMLNYAKSIQDKQIKRRELKSQGSKVHSANQNKDIERSAIHELISNSDLDRLLQRHENDKKIADQIRMKLGKIS